MTVAEKLTQSLALAERKSAWKRAMNAWDKDPCEDLTRTVVLGEAVYMDALAYIVELEAALNGRKLAELLP